MRFERQTLDLWSPACDGVPLLPARELPFVRGIYTPDLFSPEYVSMTEDTYQSIEDAGGSLVAASSVFSYGRGQPTPTLELRPIFAGAVRTPWPALGFQAAAASAHHLDVLLGPQFNMEMTAGGLEAPQDGERAWWEAWLRLAESHWMYHARLAEEVGASLLVLPGPVFHVFFPRDWLSEDFRAEFESRVSALIAEVRFVYLGEIMISGTQDYAFLADADVLGVTMYDVGHPALGPDATLDEWVAGYEALFRERVDPVHDRRGQPVLIYQVPVPSHAAPGDPGGQYQQALQLEAIYRAIAARPWISGSLSWAWMMQPVPDTPQDGFRGRLAAAVQAKWYARFEAASPR